MRTLLLTGPGGAGTTTMAAAAAVRAARAGSRTILLCREAPAVDGLDDVAGLDVVAADPQRALEALWRERAGAVAAALPQLDLPPASSVAPLPGTGELALLAELARAQADARAEVVVVDAGPLERATALLALPGTLRWWLEQALPPRLRALGAVRTAAVRSGVVRRGPADAALAAVPALEALLARVSLGDAERTGVVLVSTAGAAGVGAARSAATALGLLGHRPCAVLVRVLPDGTGEWWAQRAAAQRGALAELGAIAGVVRVPELATAPSAVDEVVGLLPAAGLPAPAGGCAPEPERLDGGWRLTVPLPFAVRAGVELTRWADDLVVTAAGVRRSIRLDALLRRCRVSGGRLVAAGTPSARLEVTFVPDPGLWPADLLGAEGGQR